MQSEPAKPITELAQPVNRSGPRGQNALGASAKWMAFLSWTGWLLLTADVLGPAAVLWGWISLFLGPVLGVAAVVLSIVALVRASNYHLERRGAITAIVVAAFPSIALACLYLILWVSSAR